MGFRKKIYTYDEDYKENDDTTYGRYKGLTSESQYDKNGSRYYMLMINDYNNNHKKMVSYQQDTLVDNNVMAKLNM